MATRALKTVEDLRALGEDVRAELIHGEILYKEGAPIEEHGGPQGLIVSWLVRRFFRSPGGRWPGGWRFGVELHCGYANNEVFCHDIAGWHRDRKPGPRDWPILLRPDWVCELISRGHEKRDRFDKLGVLQAAGVPHYWIVNGRDATLEVFRLTPEGYTLVMKATTGETIRAEPFDAVELRTDVIFGLADDEE